MARHKPDVVQEAPEALVQPETVDALAPSPAHDMLHKKDTLAAKKAVAPNDYSDWIFGGSFIAAAAFGLGNAINYIRHNFYESFVKPGAGNEALDLKQTSMTLQQAKEHHPFGDLFRQRKMEFDALSKSYATGDKTGMEFAKEKVAATVKYDKLISERAEKEFGIATKGVRSWTTDVWKQRNHTGIYARRQAAFTMATTTVVSLGAIATLKYTKHLLDRIDENERQQEALLKGQGR